ncbi:hypothetical protein C8J57DRAFT_1563360 [Mycena rebaudengoi]|nr:hypothetical protein C8J57DRAFT_1563360 [Mycena rebaudengoi]
MSGHMLGYWRKMQIREQVYGLCATIARVDGWVDVVVLALAFGDLSGPALLKDVLWVYAALEDVHQSNDNAENGWDAGTEERVRYLLEALNDARKFPVPSEKVFQVILKALSTEGPCSIPAAKLLCQAKSWFEDNDFQLIMQEHTTRVLYARYTHSVTTLGYVIRAAVVTDPYYFPNSPAQTDGSHKQAMAMLNTHLRAVSTLFSNYSTLVYPGYTWLHERRPSSTNVDHHGLPSIDTGSDSLIQWTPYIRCNLSNWITIYSAMDFFSQEELHAPYFSVLEHIWGVKYTGTYRFTEDTQKTLAWTLIALSHCPYKDEGYIPISPEFRATFSLRLSDALIQAAKKAREMNPDDPTQIENQPDLDSSRQEKTHAFHRGSGILEEMGQALKVESEGEQVDRGEMQVDELEESKGPRIECVEAFKILETSNLAPDSIMSRFLADRNEPDSEPDELNTVQTVSSPKKHGYPLPLSFLQLRSRCTPGCVGIVSKSESLREVREEGRWKSLKEAGGRRRRDGREGKGREGVEEPQGGRRREGREGKGREGKGREGKGREGVEEPQGGRRRREGKGREGVEEPQGGRRRKGREGKGWKSLKEAGGGREGKGREGKGWKSLKEAGGGREGKGREGKMGWIDTETHMNRSSHSNTYIWNPSSNRPRRHGHQPRKDQADDVISPAGPNEQHNEGSGGITIRPSSSTRKVHRGEPCTTPPLRVISTRRGSPPPSCHLTSSVLRAIDTTVGRRGRRQAALCDTHIWEAASGADKVQHGLVFGLPGEQQSERQMHCSEASDEGKAGAVTNESIWELGEPAVIEAQRRLGVHGGNGGIA